MSAAGCARRSAGPRSPAAGRSPASFHCVVPDRHAGLRRAPAGRGETRRTDRRDPQLGPHLARLPRHRLLPPARRASRCLASRKRSSTWPSRSIRNGTTYGDRRALRSPSSSTAIPVPLLWPRGARGPRPAGDLDLRYVWRICRSPTYTAGRVGREAAEAAAAQGGFWGCTTCCCNGRKTCGSVSCCRTRTSSPGPRPVPR